MAVPITAVTRPSKEALAAAIAKHLGLPPPPVSRGASVSSLFLDEVHEVLFGGPSGGVDTYRKTDRLLSRLGLVYDPWWDTSESRGDTGGGTVTTRAFSRILTAVTGVARCFVVDWPESRQDTVLEFPTNADLNPFAEAGPGSLVLLVDSTTHNLVRAYAWAEVVEMSPGWRTAPWFATLGTRVKLDVPVGVTVQGLRPGWLRLTEIPCDGLQTVFRAGAYPGGAIVPPPSSDGGAQKIAERIDRYYPTQSIPIGVARVPERDLSPVAVEPLDQSEYEETELDDNPALTATEQGPPGTARSGRPDGQQAIRGARNLLCDPRAGRRRLDLTARLPAGWGWLRPSLQASRPDAQGGGQGNPGSEPNLQSDPQGVVASND